MIVKMLGHACLYVDLGHSRLLMDPWLDMDMFNGECRRFPDPGDVPLNLPEPTHLLISHHHWDHVHPKTLNRMERSLPVLIPQNPQLLQILRFMGFDSIHILRDYDRYALSEQDFIMATPSHVPFGEIGFWIRSENGSIWNLVDCVFEQEDVAAVNHAFSQDLRITFCPYQSYDEMAQLMRVPRQTVGGVMQKNARLISELKTDMVVPAADGLWYPHSPYMNQSGFGSTPFDMVDAILHFNPDQQCVVPLPFDEFHLVKGGIRHIRPLKVPTSEIYQLYADYRSLHREPAAGYDFSTPIQHREALEEHLLDLLHADFARYDSEAMRLFERLQACFELRIEPDGPRLQWNFVQKTILREPSLSPNAWLRIQGDDLLDILQGKNLLNILMQTDRLQAGGESFELQYRALDMLWANGLSDSCRLEDFLRFSLAQ